MEFITSNEFYYITSVSSFLFAEESFFTTIVSIGVYRSVKNDHISKLFQ